MVEPTFQIFFLKQNKYLYWKRIHQWANEKNKVNNNHGRTIYTKLSFQKDHCESAFF